jgi:hypothetical protein
MKNVVTIVHNTLSFYPDLKEEGKDENGRCAVVVVAVDLKCNGGSRHDKLPWFPCCPFVSKGDSSDQKRRFGDI